MVQTKCEVYSRVVGYIRPIEQMHDAKQQEIKDRAVYKSGIQVDKTKKKDSVEDVQTSL